MEPAVEGGHDERIAALESQLVAMTGLITDLAEAQRSESMRRQEASEAALAQSVDEARPTESLAAVVDVVRSELEAVATGLAETRSALDASRAELYDALHEGVTQARLEVASLAQQLRRTEAAVAQLIETQGGGVTPAPPAAPSAPVGPSLLDDLDRQLQEAETRLARRLSTRDR